MEDDSAVEAGLAWGIKPAMPRCGRGYRFARSILVARGLPVVTNSSR